MKIKKIEIDNYRNLNEIKVKLDNELNFIVGDNNLGKSNFLKLLNILFAGKNFYENDFFDIEKSIIIKLELELEEFEIGIFDDLFSPENRKQINILAIQENFEENLSFYHLETNTFISKSKIKALNYIYYDSLRNPSSEVNFDKNKGAGKFLNYLIIRYLEDNKKKDIDFLNKDQIDEITKNVNEKLEMLELIKNYDIQSKINTEKLGEVISKIIILSKENKFDFSSTGYGIQFSFVIIFEILQNLITYSNKSRRNYNVEFDDKKYFNIILGIDEPEIHLHPYMQRNLIKYLLKIIKNEDNDFLKLIKYLIDIDILLGQIIITTHSPNIIFNSYRNIIRFFTNSEGNLEVKSGNEINLRIDLEKHLEKNINYIREAFFSKKVIFVEGDSEIGAFEEFSRKLNYDLDYYGISIISAGGADSIKPLIELMKNFGIEAYGIVDKDKYENYKDETHIFSTNFTDFEEDIFEEFNFIEYIKYIEKYESENSRFFIGESKKIGITNINPKAEIISNELNSIAPDLILTLKTNLKEKILTSLRNKKSIINGRNLAECISSVPEAYKNILVKAISGDTNE